MRNIEKRVEKQTESHRQTTKSEDKKGKKALNAYNCQIKIFEFPSFFNTNAKGWC